MASISGSYTESTESHDGVEYTRLRATSGRVLIVLEDGETFENYLLDQTQAGAYFSIVSQTSWDATPPSSYTLRNIGYDGHVPNNGRAPLVLSCTDEALAENIYLGDGVPEYPHTGNTWNDYPGAIRSSLAHSGHLIWRGVTTAKWVDNAMYCSPPANPGTGNGSFLVENCWSENNQISCYRFGSTTTIRNSYGRTQSGDHRVLWAQTNRNVSSYDLTVDNTILAGHGNGIRAITHRDEANVILDANSQYTGENGTGSVSGGQLVDDPPRLTPDDVGAPTSALAAATGQVADPDMPDPEPNPPDKTDTLAVETRTARDISTTGARLRGDLTGIDADEVDVYFEWRQVDE